MVLRDGTEVELDQRDVRQPLESALRALTAAVVLLAGGLVAARMLGG